MGYFDGLYGNSSNSNSLATNNSGGYFGDLFNTPSPTPHQDQPMQTMQNIQQPDQQPQGKNWFQGITDTITQAVKSKLQQIFHPNPTVNTFQLPNISQNSIQKATGNANQPFASDFTLSSTPNQNTPSANMGITSQSLSQEQQAVNTSTNFVNAVKNAFPNTINDIQQLGVDPLSLHANPTKAISDAWNTLSNTVKQEAPKIKAYFDTNPAIGLNLPNPSPDSLSKNLEGVSAAANIAFAPLTALFSGANDIPVLGSVTKLLTLPFTFAGEGGTAASNTIVDHLPISQQAKDQIKPALGEISALAAQIALGAATEVGADKKAELVKQFGQTDANTIVQQATKLGEQKRQIDFISSQQPALEAPKTAGLLQAQNPTGSEVQGQGFVMTDKANQQKINSMKAVSNYKDALDRYNANPSPARLQKVLRTRVEMKRLEDNGLLQRTDSTAQPKAPGSTPNATFTPTNSWQEVPKDTVVPPGGQYKFDQATGRTYARWDNPPTPEVKPATETATPTDEQLIADYHKQFPNNTLLNTDNVREVYKPQGYNRVNSALFRERSSALSDKIFHEDLSKLQPGDNYLFTAGSSGAGKSTALASDPFILKDVKAGLDGNFSSDSSLKKLDQVIAKGANARIAYVYRDPLEAWNNGVLRRAANPENGRVVPLDVFLKNLENSRNKVLEAYQKYGDKVDIQAFDNSTHGVRIVSDPIEFLKNIHYNMSDVKSELIKSTEERIQNGTLSEEAGKALLGNEAPKQLQQEHSGEQTSTVNPPEKPTTTAEGKTPSKIAKSIEQKAADQGLTDVVGELAGYDKQKIQEQKDMAAKVMQNVDEARAMLRGEKPLPKGLNPVALIDAAERYIEKTGDPNVLMDLSKSHLVSETSQAAQVMRFAAERQPDSLTAKLQDLKKTREDTLTRRTGKTVDQALKDEAAKIKEELKRTAPKKEDWASFISSIQC